ncbi:MAG: hypothetical protein Q4G67_07925 [Actinomycetia bacterium]|nr:hypothetical protein [Actinomycetes bacterium]
MSHTSPRDAVEPAEPRRINTNKILLFVIGFVVLALLIWIGSAVVPRWWAQRVGSMVDGRLTFGGALGVIIGGVFTAAPLIFLGLAVRHLRSIGRALSAVLFGLVLALPNIVTLAIVLGASNAAHAGQRILDVDAPGFKAGSLIGAIIGALFGLWIIYLMWSRRRRGRELARLHEDEQRRDRD